MKRFSVILAVSAAALFLTASQWKNDRPIDTRDSHARAEAVRLRAHFDMVDRELTTRDVSHLSAEQRESRAKLIGWLRDYRDAGQFPLNDRFPDRTVPIFRDSEGTLCAMAYLVDRSGAGDIVDRVAKKRNYAFIGELTDDQALVSWLDASGLSVSEAARIQPQYEYDPIVVDSDKSRVSAGYALLSMGLSGSSLATLGFNAFSPSPNSGAAGIVAGVATIVAGAVRFRDDNGDERVAQANVAVGSLALIAGARTLYLAHRRQVQPQSAGLRHRIVSRAGIMPDVILSETGTQVGLRMRATF